MTTSTNLMRQRRFLPLFLTQLLNAFNDNLYKNAMVLFVVYQVYDSPETETMISGLATALFVLPFVLFSATSGQLADMRDKTKIIRWIKFAEIIIMCVGAAGLVLAARGMAIETIAMPLMFVALFAMGVHSTFFGPIKYAILPQHLEKDEVLAGTGLVEAGTYVAILAGMILGGVMPIMWSIVGVILVAVVGYMVCRWVPPAPAQSEENKVDWNPIRASKSLITFTMSNPELRYSVLAISYFWTIAAILSVQFIPLAKNVLLADKQVAAVLLVAFSAGIAIGSVSINALLKGDISARYSARSVIVMAVLLISFYALCKMWDLTPAGELFTVWEFLAQPLALAITANLLLIAVAGGMFVVPLYAFLTTRVDKSEASRSVAANNFVSSIYMVVGAGAAGALGYLGIPLEEQVLVSLILCALSARLSRKLHATEALRDPENA
ncbi:MFS transporter [Porphyrobacter sp. LM 6]|uniref:MFS transporter n=1 Tax=Porphyrobacter sp. LM 6 TaxID=1896196 RepID=UPI000847CB9B|nr:MFS transporter [Porphyrobacter sp. LM 6]AOL94542.1 Major Facilitator Superfamily protein [Porphyrobacter sp. LM 6]